ncbi:MAG: response regulator [Desulfuromonadales bacterium]
MARILVIDDEPHLRILVESFLVQEGHEVDLAENGQKGLNLIERNPYDLVITDVVMPEQDGLEVLMGLKGHVPRMKIIVMSGGGDRLNIQELLNLAKLMGADRVLPKPLDFTTLQATVKDVLEIRP